MLIFWDIKVDLLHKHISSITAHNNWTAIQVWITVLLLLRLLFSIVFTTFLKFSEQGGIVVQPGLALRHDRLLCDDPRLLRRVYLHDEARGPTLRPLQLLLPVLQRPVSGQLLDPPADRPAADNEDGWPAVQHWARAVWGSAGQRLFLHHVWVTWLIFANWQIIVTGEYSSGKQFS